MATYAQLAAIQADANWAAFSEKIRVAVIMKADAIRRDAGSTAAQKAWAVKAIQNPVQTMENVRAMIVAAAQGDNANITIAQITVASDANIQTYVNAAADFFAANGG